MDPAPVIASRPAAEATRPADRSEPVMDPPTVLFREIRRELFPYFGFEPEAQHVEQVLKTVEGTRERGCLVGGAEVRESVQRALAWWRANRDSANPSGLYCFNRAWAELLAERKTEASEPINPDLGAVPCETTRRELARLEKRWGAAILARDTPAQEACIREVSAVYERLKWRGDPLRACCSASRDGARDWAQRLHRQQAVGSRQ